MCNFISSVTAIGQYITDTVEIFGIEHDVRIYYAYHPPMFGSTDGPGGPKIEPDEGEWWEVTNVLLKIQGDWIQMDIDETQQEIFEDDLRDKLGDG